MGAHPPHVAGERVVEARAQPAHRLPGAGRGPPGLAHHQLPESVGADADELGRSRPDAVRTVVPAPLDAGAEVELVAENREAERHLVERTAAGSLVQHLDPAERWPSHRGGPPQLEALLPVQGAGVEMVAEHAHLHHRAVRGVAEPVLATGLPRAGGGVLADQDDRLVGLVRLAVRTADRCGEQPPVEGHQGPVGRDPTGDLLGAGQPTEAIAVRAEQEARGFPPRRRPRTDVQARRGARIVADDRHAAVADVARHRGLALGKHARAVGPGPLT